MDGIRLDAIRKTFDTFRTPRRSVLKAGAAGMLGAAAIQPVQGQDATPEPGSPEDDPAFMFVQSFMSGTLTPIAAGSATPADIDQLPGATPVAIQPPDYLLTLQHDLGQTIYFSDRPDRIVGTMPTGTFLDNLGFTPVNPPNAALVGDLGNGDEEILVVELTNPIYDPANGTIVYEVRLLSGFESVDMQFENQVATIDPGGQDIGVSHLFIDDCPNAAFTCTTPNWWLVCASPGTIDEGTCFQKWSLTCQPCRDYAPICNQMFPKFCKGKCIVKTQDEVRRQCIGN